MTIVFLVEEMSMKVFLTALLPRILPEGVSSIIVPHEGKCDFCHAQRHQPITCILTCVNAVARPPIVCIIDYAWMACVIWLCVQSPGHRFTGRWAESWRSDW